jgi:hypothetical protein
MRTAQPTDTTLICTRSRHRYPRPFEIWFNVRFVPWLNVFLGERSEMNVFLLRRFALGFRPLIVLLVSQTGLVQGLLF